MLGLLPASRMCVDELVWRIQEALRLRRLSGWNLEFGKSVAARAKRRGWMPTPKQLAAMRRVVTELRAPEPDFGGERSLIDHEDGGG